MNESEQYIADQIKVWVWSGFYEQDELSSMMEDILEEDVDEDLMMEFINSEWAKKKEDEKSWPPETDCDRLDIVFAELLDSKIAALQNAGYTMSDGHSDVAEFLHEYSDGEFEGYCFFHGQDLERVVNGDDLMLAFGDLDDTEAGKKAIGKTICNVLNRNGFKTIWDGDPEQRISIPGIIWRRRLN